MDLIVTSVKGTGARCRILDSGKPIVLRAVGLKSVVPGEIVTVFTDQPRVSGRSEYVTGEITAVRIDAPALGLRPLRLDEWGVWDPAEEYWGEEGEPLPDWALPIIAKGQRPVFEMAQVLPGDDPDDPESDPIIQSNDLRDLGDTAGARQLLMDLLDVDLRCLDAHAHLGNLAFSRRPQQAIKHYEVGVRIGELMLGADFAGVLPWGCIDNRPFLRCMHGYGLCLWRLGRAAEAASNFERMLWLNPSDNQGERFNLHWIQQGRSWEETKDWG